MAARRYVDNEGSVQGPFATVEIEAWHAAGFLAEDTLKMAGGVEGSAAPATPSFTLLGHLIAAMMKDHKVRAWVGVALLPERKRKKRERGDRSLLAAVLG